MHRSHKLSLKHLRRMACHRMTIEGEIWRHPVLQSGGECPKRLNGSKTSVAVSWVVTAWAVASVGDKSASTADDRSTMEDAADCAAISMSHWLISAIQDLPKFRDTEQVNSPDTVTFYSHSPNSPGIPGVSLTPNPSVAARLQQC